MVSKFRRFYHIITIEIVCFYAIFTYILGLTIRKTYLLRIVSAYIICRRGFYQIGSFIFVTYVHFFCSYHDLPSIRFIDAVFSFDDKFINQSIFALSMRLYGACTWSFFIQYKIIMRLCQMFV